MKINKFKKFLGWNYIVNHNTREIHKLNSSDKKCRIFYITNGNQVRKKKAMDFYYFDHYDGCKHCLKDLHHV
jgi:hypothetical protein